MQLHDAQTVSCAPAKSPQPHVSQRKHSLDAVPHTTLKGAVLLDVSIFTLQFSNT